MIITEPIRDYYKPYDISTVTLEYLQQRQISNLKYLPGYLLAAKWTWKDLFWNTLYIFQSSWQKIKCVNGQYYIDVPKGAIRILSVSTIDDCNNTVPLFYNSNVNSTPFPVRKSCGCEEDCGCGSTCCDVNTFTTQTIYKFTDGGIDYYEKIYLKYCKDGSVIEKKEIPSKKYNDYIGDGGDYNPDYNSDYNKPVFSNYTIVTETEQRCLCELDVKMCGCPVDTPKNQEKIKTYLLGFLPLRHCERPLLENINNNGYGSVYLSDCRAKIFYIPGRREFVRNKMPENLLVSYQNNGENNLNSAIIVPEYAVETMQYGIDFRSKRWNNAYSDIQQRTSKYAYENAVNDLITFLNPIDLNWLQNIRDVEVLW